MGSGVERRGNVARAVGNKRYLFLPGPAALGRAKDPLYSNRRNALDVRHFSFYANSDGLAPFRRMNRNETPHLRQNGFNDLPTLGPMAPYVPTYLSNRPSCISIAL